jgi:hypothetical protein
MSALQEPGWCGEELLRLSNDAGLSLRYSARFSSRFVLTLRPKGARYKTRECSGGRPREPKTTAGVRCAKARLTSCRSGGEGRRFRFKDDLSRQFQVAWL